eukprot:CAMPEP_0113962074 /NCGR_PEP_ID=MMETSP0011_2-20120614/5696_1 /TAXON_ID=101924 /ORGANISM="Rhodosorus marinus" /LENGTH=317 /DNA_ID=CAMNT_0000973853 /DNA_START=105 /DNA_END=1058 /DNA_ORIENTATION=+ /assembly_acc=CAM_ASM_000156
MRGNDQLAMIHSGNPLDGLIRLLAGGDRITVASAGSSSDDLSPGESFKIGLISGAIAGTVVDFVLFPLDTLKTRLQSGTAAKDAMQLLKGIYTGLLPAVLASAPAGAAFFGTYDYLKRVFKQLDPEEKLATFHHMVAAAGGDIAGSAVRVPFEVVKQRLQAGAYTSASQAVKSILASEGVRGLYTGFGSLVIREMPFDLIEFPLYEYLKVVWARHNGDKPLATWQTALCGSAAGGFAAGVTTPLDVVKTRLMLQEQPGKYSGVWDALKKISAEEGVQVLASGIVPRVLWISLGGFIFFGGYEASKQVLSSRIKKQRT